MSHSGIPACPTCGERLSALRLSYKEIRLQNMEKSDKEKMNILAKFQTKHVVSACCIPHLQQCVELNEILIRKS